MSVSLTSRPLGPEPTRHARTLLEIFAETVQRFGANIAIDASAQQLSYRDLDEVVVALAQRLTALGIGPGDRVGVRVASGTAELYSAILGVIRSGAAYVPVDADDPPARAEAVWSGAGVCAVVADELRIIERTPGAGADRRLAADDDAWIIFTSGSTGQPKGVAVSHRSAAAFVEAEADLWDVQPEDRVLAGLSVGFDASCEEMWLAWRNGAALVPAPRALVRSGSELGPWLAELGVTVVSTVPTLAAMWNTSDIAGVRLLILGGEACSDVLGWRLAADREVWNTYGPTEATVVSTAVSVRRGEAITIGWPLRGWDVAIVDEHGERLPFGEPGELAIGGVGLARYIDAALDAERYAPLPGLGWQRAYRTGDIAYETVDGVQFIGRRDDQVKLGGRRLELGEIDGRMSAVAGVRAACAAVQPTSAGNPVLVGYMVGSANPADVRDALTHQLPDGVVPLVVKLEALPMGSSGKVDRRALPWPPPATPAGIDTGTPTPGRLSDTEAWLAERWAEQLGPLPISADSDFFALGGTSMAAAKLVSVLRDRFATVAVADIYNHRRLCGLAARLDGLDIVAPPPAPSRPDVQRRWGLVQLAGVFALLSLSTPQWLLGILAIDNVSQGAIGPTVGWGWLIGGWLVFGSATGRAAIVVLARRLLLGHVRPGRYPRHGWLTCRLWFLERLSEAFRFESLAGTPFAARYARLCGHLIGAGARLGTLPPVTSSVVIGAGATIEGGVDLRGWWLAGDELIIGDLAVGAGARIGTRTLLSPGAVVGAGAEIEPGSVISGSVPAGERWGGSPGARVGLAGEQWPSSPAPSSRHARFWKAMFGLGIVIQAILPLAAATPGLILLAATGAGRRSSAVTTLLTEAPLIAALFLLTYGLLVALLVRLVGLRLRPGWHPDEGGIGWALWLNEALMAGACGVLRPLFLSLITRRWLGLAGIPVARGAELSTAVGYSRLTSFASDSFVTDDVVFAPARSRRGWLHVAGIEVGDRTFVGNSAILSDATSLGSDGLIGVLTTPPRRTPDGTSWLGSPALELPRIPDRPDRSRTFAPPRRLIAARAVLELIRSLLPATVSVALAGLVVGALEAIGADGGIVAMAVATPFILAGAGLCAVAVTVTLKWLLMGRYRPGEHPFWSFFVWRDEIVNCLQEELARPWLLASGIGTPVMNWYLRAMGAKVGRNVCFETLAVTEFDVVALGDGCVVNRGACVETHLFHDRLMRIGPAQLGPGSTLGPASVVLPNTVLGAGARVGARSVVLRGEELPAGSSWHGSPVVCD